VKNLVANPAMSVHLSSEAEAIILEGTAELVVNASHPLAAPPKPPRSGPGVNPGSPRTFLRAAGGAGRAAARRGRARSSIRRRGW
jgi:hypothetical protein